MQGNDQIFTFIKSRQCRAFRANQTENLYKLKGHRGEMKRENALGCHFKRLKPIRGGTRVAALLMENSMKLAKFIGSALVALSLSATALAQQAPGGQPDQVAQLAQMVGLSEEQQTEIRGIIDDMQGEIGELRQDARSLQEDLQEQIKPDYDESAIRDNAVKLGDVTGEIAALSALMQAKVDAVFTQEQRDELDRRMQQMQQQMQQQRQMMQPQGQQ